MRVLQMHILVIYALCETYIVELKIVANAIKDHALSHRSIHSPFSQDMQLQISEKSI